MTIFEDVFYYASDGFAVGCSGTGWYSFCGVSVNLIRHGVAENVNFFDRFKTTKMCVDGFISWYSDDQSVAEVV